MTVPRELKLKSGKLIQNPVRELENYRRNEVACRDVRLCEADGQRRLPGISGRVLDMTLDVDVRRASSFTVHLASDGDYVTTVSYDVNQGTLTTDRTYSGQRKDMICSRTMYVDQKDGCIRLRVLLDKYALELLVNDGEQAMTSLLYTPLEADGIAFSCTGEAVFDITKYDIIV